MSEELVMCIPRPWLYEHINPIQGFTPNNGTHCKFDLMESLNKSEHYYIKRSLAENDEHYKQLIPYCVFHYEDDLRLSNLFNYRRKGGGEGRLEGKRSIGVGGHISILDSRLKESFGDTYATGLLRELKEETTIISVGDHSMIGLVNDDSNAVGRVHLGVVHLFDSSVTRVTLVNPQSELHDPQWTEITKLFEEIDQFETWSQIILKEYFHVRYTERLKANKPGK